VFTLGTVSKSLAPAIRLGWVLAPPALAAAVAEGCCLTAAPPVLTSSHWPP
jgi:GntR family transcriptional regulator/MocR family aminotransferase